MKEEQQESNRPEDNEPAGEGNVVETAEAEAPVEEKADAAEVEAPAEEAFDREAIVEIKAGELKQLHEAAAKAVENWDRLLREKAETDNFKKRAARDRQDAIAYANEALLERLLPIMDNFDMAMMAADSAEDSSVESIRVGVKMIHGQLKSFLSDSGLEEIDALGGKFDPNVHEALSQEESEEAEEGTVIKQTRKGYKLKDRLIRPASVVVARKPSED